MLSPNLGFEMQITMENLEMDFHGPPYLLVHSGDMPPLGTVSTI